MESPPPLARYVPHTSKKRVFPGGSSMEEDVVEIPPPVNRTSNSLKRKEIYDIIDVDIEEDCNDARLGEGSFIPNGKGKEIFVDLSLGTGGGSENTATVKGFLTKNKNFTSEPQNVINLEDSDDLYGDNEHMDMFYDESTLDQYTNLQVYLDRMDVPPGVEASIPWWPGPSGDKLSSICSSTPSYLSPAQMKAASISSGKMSTHPSESVNFHKLKEKVTSRSGSSFGDRSGRTRKLGLSVPFVEPALGVKRSAATGSSIDTDSTYKDSLEFSLQGQGQKLGLRGFSQSKKRSPRATTSFGSHNLSTPLEPYFPKVTAKSWMADWMNVLPNSTNHSTADSPSLFSHVLPDGLLPPVGFVSLYPDPVTSHKNTNATENAPAPMQSRNIDEIVERFSAFKKFDTVQDYAGHHYSRNASRKVNAASKAWVKRIQEEWKILEKDLPDTIFVRVYESRMDLLRAVIVGAAGTPYHDGLFFFDVYFPSSYPNVPPQVYYHSGGLRINPNLYNCGKVCLSLLNTWSGQGKEKWMPRESTMLQVLVSIQGLILNAKPYFNEPGFAGSEGTVPGEQSSLQYNENTYISNLRTMLYSIRKPPKHFEDFVAGHFVLHAQDILVACKTYIDGAQVGSLVSGGVQDVDEGDKSCSDVFKNSVVGLIKTLVESFTQVGAKDCDKFLYLAEKATVPVSASLTSYGYHYY
nr:probable ubiquitin-conjugating enzyme E2 26 [Ipomoea batatas]